MTYIYGIIGEPQPKRFAFTGIEDAGVYTINFRELAAVVSSASLPSIDPLRRHVMAHTVVQVNVLREYAILPAAFGLIASGEDDVRSLLERNYQSLLDELARLSGKVEFELKVMWDREAVLRNLREGNGRLDRIKAELSSTSSPLEAQALLIEAGRMVEAITKEWRDRYAMKIYERLRHRAVDARTSEPTGINSLLKAAFLIELSGERSFQSEVSRLDAEYEGRVNFKCVGPLPPYSFVNTSLVRSDAAG